MITGTVKFFNNDKGYGFIAPEDGGTDAFVHISAVERAGLSSLNEGQKISFEAKKDPMRGKTPTLGRERSCGGRLRRIPGRNGLRVARPVDQEGLKHSGREVAARLLENAPSAKVIFMTGYDDQLDTFYSLPGDATILEKPFPLNTLLVRARLRGIE